MFDARLRPIIDPPLNAIGSALARAGIGANAVTVFGAILGVAAGVAIACEHYGLALALIIANRLADGLDGAVARVGGISDFGGFLDSIADYIFYIAVPLGFGFASAANTAAAMTLIAAFTLTAVSFLAFAAIAAKRGEATTAHGKKSLFYSSGLMEGAETIAFFIAFCLWPAHFATLATIFTALCLLTVVQRGILARRQFRDD